METVLCEKHSCKYRVTVEINGHHGFACIKGVEGQQTSCNDQQRDLVDFHQSQKPS